MKKVLLTIALFALVLGVACKKGGYTIVKCGDSARRFMKKGVPVLVKCPKKCNKSYGSVWGTDIYTTDSSICRVAIHAGVITKSGGFVRIKFKPGKESYEGTERNGIKTSSWGSFPKSFVVRKK